MTIQDFINTKSILIKELEEHFKEVKRIDVDALYTKGCLNCQDKVNQHTYPGEPWTGIRYC